MLLGYYKNRILSSRIVTGNEVVPMTDVAIMQDNSEIVHYDQIGVPFSVRTGRLSDFTDRQAVCHWHEDLEFICVLKGSMNYYVNGKRVLLKDNDSLMVNSRQMHYGYSVRGRDCEFICFLFNPRMFTANVTLCRNYVIPVLENPNVQYLYFDANSNEGREMAGCLKSFVAMKTRGASAWELELIGHMHINWSRIVRYMEVLPPDPEEQNVTDLKIQKDMVTYIYRHYAEKLTLADIAAAGHVCRNKCCLIFKRYLQQSPVDFLNSYRLRMSLQLLNDREKSITEIALACGFNHLSYYSKMFYDNYGCTPSQYRKLDKQN